MEVIHFEAECQGGVDFNIVNQRVQIRFAPHPAQSEVGVERAILGREADAGAGGFHPGLQRFEPHQIPAQAAPDYSGIPQVGEGSETLQAQRERTATS